MKQEKIWNRYKTFSHVILEFRESRCYRPQWNSAKIFIERRKRALMVVWYFIIVLPLVFHTALMAWFDSYKAKQYTGQNHSSWIKEKTNHFNE